MLYLVITSVLSTWIVRRPSNFSGVEIGCVASPQPLALVCEIGIMKKDGSVVWCGVLMKVGAQPFPSLERVRGGGIWLVLAACSTTISGYFFAGS